jgi:hypothetical protein
MMGGKMRKLKKVDPSSCFGWICIMSALILLAWGFRKGMPHKAGMTHIPLSDTVKVNGLK